MELFGSGARQNIGLDYMTEPMSHIFYYKPLLQVSGIYMDSFMVLYFDKAYNMPRTGKAPLEAQFMFSVVFVNGNSEDPKCSGIWAYVSCL